MSAFVMPAFGSAALAGQAGVGNSRDDPGPDVASSDSALSYEAEYFRVFNPVTALDMVERLPGFTIDSGEDVRGFGGAAGNVLVDGVRPSAKGQLLTDFLGQIPADNVERIDLIRGRTAGIDMRGQPVVANVVLVQGRAAAGISGFATLEFRLSEDGKITPNGEVSVSGAFQGFTYRLGARRAAVPDLDDQPETLAAPDGTLLEFRPETVDIFTDPWTFTGNLERDFGGWQTRLNGEVAFRTLRFDEISPSFDAATGDLLRTNTTSVVDDTSGMEIGFDVEKPLSERFEWRLIGLQSLGMRRFEGVFVEERSGGGLTQVSQSIADRSGESILRTVLAFTPGNGSAYEAGIEGAYNFLDSNVDLFIDTGTGPIPQDLPISDTKVEEYRGEIFANGSWRPSSSLALEAGLTLELSSLQQSGDAEEKRVFLFPKPAVNLTYDMTARDQLRLSLLREVAQLDFTDFVTSTELNEQTTDFGNPQLVPQRDWVARMEWERRFTEDDSLILLLEYRRLQDVQDFIPVNGLFDAPGNIGDGTALRARIDWQFTLDRFGLPGAVLEGWYQYADTDVTDPVTGEKRGITFASPSTLLVREHELRLSFRQDLADQGWAWGGEYTFLGDHKDFRINEERHENPGAFLLSVFSETTRFLAAKVRIEAFVREPRWLRERIFFAGTRASGIITAIEVRDRRFEKQALLSIQKTF